MTVDLTKAFDKLTALGLVKTEGSELTLTVGSWSDYHGSVLDRANALHLTREFSDEVAETYSGRWADSSLYLLTRNISHECADAIIGASQYADYPVLNEETLWEVEGQLKDEAWEGYMLHDLKGLIEDEWQIDDFDETFPRLSNSDLSEVFTREYLEANCGEFGHAETADTWVWPIYNVVHALPAILDTIAAMMAEEVDTQGRLF